ncbi:MAG: hypothetical protein GY697_11255 [Desulfobacterales bacterium]|nr:hypothetical protein [Desulfobacterales bacterium]
MDISCKKCQAGFKIPDEKVPQGKAFSIKCPKCKEIITVSPQAEKKPLAEAPATPAPVPTFDEAPANKAPIEGYDASDRPFDFLEEGVETALICEGDPVYRGKIETALQSLGYQVTYPSDAREALKQMRFHVFDMIVVNEKFDTPDPDHNNVLRYLAMLPMGVRRNIFVALVSDRFRSNDNMAAFHKSVNMVIGVTHIDDIEKIIKHGITENDIFYRVYKESLVKTGRA